MEIDTDMQLDNRIREGAYQVRAAAMAFDQDARDKAVLDALVDFKQTVEDVTRLRMLDHIQTYVTDNQKEGS